MLLAACAVGFSSCSDDEGGTKVMPQLDPNNTDITMTATGGTKAITVKNAVELNITSINDKTGNKGSVSNEYSIENGKLKDSKNVTEAGWFTAEVVKVDGVYKKIVFSVIPNTSTEASRDKYIHVTCGGNLYGLSIHLMQEKAAKPSDSSDKK